MWTLEWRIKIHYLGYCIGYLKPVNTDTNLCNLLVYAIWILWIWGYGYEKSYLHIINHQSVDGFYVIWSLYISFLILYGKTGDNAVWCKRVWQQVWILNLESLKNAFIIQPEEAIRIHNNRLAHFNHKI